MVSRGKGAGEVAPRIGEHRTSTSGSATAMAATIAIVRGVDSVAVGALWPAVAATRPSGSNGGGPAVCLHLGLALRASLSEWLALTS